MKFVVNVVSKNKCSLMKDADTVELCARYAPPRGYAPMLVRDSPHRAFMPQGKPSAKIAGEVNQSDRAVKVLDTSDVRRQFLAEAI